MMKFLSLMTAASVAETESKDKMKGKIPKYPATAEPLDEGSSTVWMKWEPDFKTYANINNLAPLLTPPHYGKVQIPAEIANGPDEPVPPAEGIPQAPEQPGEEAAADVQEAYIRDQAEYERISDAHALYKAQLEAYTLHVDKVKDDMLNIWKPRYEIYVYKQQSLRLALREAVEGNDAMETATLAVDPEAPDIGTQTYFAMRHAATNPIGEAADNEDAIDEHQLKVLEKIVPMDDTGAVRTFIQEYMVYYYNMWAKLFTPTPECPMPWCERVSVTLVIKKIQKCLPIDPTWDGFVQAIANDLKGWINEYRRTKNFFVLKEYLKAMDTNNTDRKISHESRTLREGNQ